MDTKQPQKDNFLMINPLDLWKTPWKLINSNKQLLKKRNISLVTELGRAPLKTEFGDWTYVIFGDNTTSQHHEMLFFGQLDDSKTYEDILVRVHCSCRTNEVYHSVYCECRDEIHRAMELIKHEGKGIIIYLDQEGRGTGIVGKIAQLNGMFGWKNGKIVHNIDRDGVKIDTARAYQEAGYPAEIRQYAMIAPMLKSIGVNSIRLLTNNPLKVAEINELGIKTKMVEIHIEPKDQTVSWYLQTKAEKLGHVINPEHYRLKK